MGMDNTKDERLVAMEARWDAIIPTLATKADIEALRAAMQKMSADTYKWMVGSLIGLFIGFGGLGYSMAQVLKQPPPAPAIAQPPATIIINIPPQQK